MNSVELNRYIFDNFKAFLCGFVATWVIMASILAIPMDTNHLMVCVLWGMMFTLFVS